MKPSVTENYDLKSGEVDKEKIIKIMVDDHEFSQERIDSALKKILEMKKAGKQASLTGWFGKKELKMSE